MSNAGGWVINPSTDYPQKIATAVANLNDLLGCSYEAICYLGYQIVNGTNHAVLAEQTILNGKDTKNAVILVFNEKSGSLDVSLIGVLTLVAGGGDLGGPEVDVTTDVPKDAQLAFDESMAFFVGSDIKIVTYLGSQIVKGTNFKYLVTVKAVTPGAVERLAVLTVNSIDKNVVSVEPILSNGSLGYAFTWLSTQDGVKKLHTPLGEWP